MPLSPIHEPTDSALNHPLPGFGGLRGTVLLLLKKADGLSAKELAAAAGASLNAVRHHLKELQREQLVAYRRRHRGVGAPSYAYALTAAGHALFPRGYEVALAGVLDELVERDGRDAAVFLLEARYVRLAQQLQRELGGLESDQRMAAVAAALSAQGYMAEVAFSADGGTLVQHNCAIQALAERFPEVCAAEAKFLALVLGGEVQRKHHILAGCSACEYRIRLKPTAGPAETEERA